MRAAVAICKSALPVGVRPFSASAFQFAGPTNPQAAVQQQRRKEILQRVEQQAKSNDVKAQLALGRFHAEGSHTLKPDAAVAAHWFQKVAEAGDVRGLVELAALYANPKLSIADPHKAEKYLLEAIGKGSTAAHNHLARLYISAGPLHDPAKGTKVLHESAARGDATALHFLSQLYRTGELAAIPADAGKADELQEKAAEAGSSAAQIALARQYLYGLNGRQKDTDKAKQLLDLAIKKDINASVLFANAFREDVTRRDDITTYLRRAAAERVAGAYATLAEHYYIIKDWANASRIYSKISAQYLAQSAVVTNEAAAARARRQVAIAQLRLGKMYATGWEGQPADAQQARMWLQRAAANGSDVAQLELGKIFLADGDEARAVEAFTHAAHLPPAATQLATLLLQKNTEQDGRAAEKHLIAAADKGFVAASRLLSNVYSRGAPGIAADSAKAEKYRVNSTRPRADEA